MIDELIKLADHLDRNGYYKEADYIDERLRKNANMWTWFKRGVRLTPGAIMAEILFYAMMPASTAADNSCGHCHVTWPYDMLNEQMDLSLLGGQENWPERLKKIIKDLNFDQCCSWTDEDNGNGPEDRMRFAYAINNLNDIRYPETLRLFREWRDKHPEEVKDEEKAYYYGILGHPL